MYECFTPLECDVVVRVSANYSGTSAASMAVLYLNINMCTELVTLLTRVSFSLYFSYVILVVNKSWTAVLKMR